VNIWQQVLDFEPFLRSVNIEATALGPTEVVLSLQPRQEIANHLGEVHGGAQFTLGESTALAVAVLSLGMELDQVAVLTRGASISYQRGARGGLTARAPVLRAERERLQADWHSKKRARLSVPVEITDATGQMVTTLEVDCLVLPRA
jgi:uncharacterized protein (TIGR00369 family)